MKKENGITLIALVITIIVMLILVIVTVSFALNGDLFGKARTASQDYRAAQINEAVALAKTDIYAAFYHGDYTSGQPTEQDVTNLIDSYLDGDLKGKVTCTAKSTTSSGTTYTIAVDSTVTNLPTGFTPSVIFCDFWKSE